MCAPRKKAKDESIEDVADVNYYEQDEKGQVPRRIDNLGRNELLDELKRELESGLGDSEEQAGQPSELDNSPGAEQRREEEELFSLLKDPTPPSSRRRDSPFADVLPHHIATATPLPRQSEICLDRLNETLNESSFAPDDNKRRNQLWIWYERSKLRVPSLTRMIPADAWDVLWETQDNEISPERGPRLARLAQDKLGAGWDLSSIEQNRRIEGLFLDNKHSEALQAWKTAETDEHNRKDEDFLELGIRMHARAGMRNEASGLLDRIFEHYPAADPRLIQPVIDVYIRENSDDSIAHAWLLYHRLRERLSLDMKMDDYDATIHSFFSVGRKGHALAVFRDMMLCNDPMARKDETFYRTTLDRVMKFVDNSESATAANEVSLEAITYLPRRYQNKFFYASWLRKLISEGWNDEASQVIELMYERNVRPDARHMNGLISAWLRADSAKDTKKAEQLGWAMIQGRLDFVQHRAREATGQEQAHTSIHDNSEDIKVAMFLDRPVPSATIETFCVLLQHHLKRGMYGHARHLRNLLVPAALQMNSYFMNHLLQAELYVRGYRRAWNRFQIMVQSVKPDMDTWAFLWECMKKHTDSGLNQDPNGFPSPRELFRSWRDWLGALKGPELNSAFTRFELETYHDVLRSFCLSRDMAGCFVAMHAMHETFGICPQDTTTRLLVALLARLNTAEGEQVVGARRRKKSLSSQQTKSKIKDVLHVVWKQRLEQMIANGYEYEKLEPDHQAEENHRTLLSLLLAVMKTQGEASDALQSAAQALQVEVFDPEEAIALTA
ncbi:MAG: hypothetical protein M1828_003361 [Chrysothrix sp. TS-e1954]|nr:MAG: hypothetical protein M1828_003361 [Chrysothrix sp. TS-e1954]